MIDRSHALPVTRQARELRISRGSIYYLPRPTSPADLAVIFGECFIKAMAAPYRG